MATFMIFFVIRFASLHLKETKLNDHSLPWLLYPNCLNVLKEKSKSLGWPLRLRIAKDVANGCAFLHAASPPIIHRDLKSPNVLVMLSVGFLFCNDIALVIFFPYSVDELIRESRGCCQDCRYFPFLKAS